MITVKELRDSLANVEDTLPVVFTFNGITESGEICAVSSANKTKLENIYGEDEESNSEYYSTEVFHLFCNRERFP